MIDLKILGSNGPLSQAYVNERPLEAFDPEHCNYPFLFIDGVCYQAMEFSLKIRPGKAPVEFYARGLLACSVGDQVPAVEAEECVAFLEAKPPRGEKGGLCGFNIGRLRSLGRLLPGLTYLEVSMRPGSPMKVKLVFAPESINFSLSSLTEVDLDFADMEEELLLDVEACTKARQDFMRDNADALPFLEDF